MLPLLYTDHLLLDDPRCTLTPPVLPRCWRHRAPTFTAHPSAHAISAPDDPLPLPLNAIHRSSPRMRFTDPPHECDSQVIAPEPGKSRYTIEREIKAKEHAIETLARRYANRDLPAEDLKQCIYSIGDNHAYLYQVHSAMLDLRGLLACSSLAKGKQPPSNGGSPCFLKWRVTLLSSPPSGIFYLPWRDTPGSPRSSPF